MSQPSETDLDAILKSLGIDSDEENENDDFDVSVIPEEHREIVEKTIKAKEQKINELQRNYDVVNTKVQTMQESLDKALSGKSTSDDDSQEDDDVDPKIKALEEKISKLESSLTVDEEKRFNNIITQFASKNPDVKKYAKDMDAVASHLGIKRENITEQNLPLLFSFAKGIGERRDNLQKQARDELKIKKAALSKQSESGGTSRDSVGPGQPSSIAEAMESAITILSQK